MQQPAPRGTTPVAWIVVALALASGVGVAAAAMQGADRRAHPEATAFEPVREPVAPIPDAPMTLADASRRVSIEMYSAAWCQACGRAKAWMHEHDVAFHEIDVDQRAGALAQLGMLNPRRTLPTFDVDGQVVVGFEEPRLRGAIEDGARRTLDRD